MFRYLVTSLIYLVITYLNFELLSRSYNIVTKGWTIADANPTPTARFGHTMVFFDVSCIFVTILML